MELQGRGDIFEKKDSDCGKDLLRRLLITGVPRSGTTWLGRVLRRTAGTRYVDEPDNEVKEPFALKTKRGMGTFPALAPGDEASGLERLWDLAFGGRIRDGSARSRVASALLQRSPRDAVRAGVARDRPRHTIRTITVRMLAAEPSHEQVGSHVLVKSVYVPLCLEWITERWSPEVIVSTRHPYNIVSSWMSLGYTGHGLDTNPLVERLYVEPLDLPRLPRNASWIQRISWEVGLLGSVLAAAVRNHPEWHVVHHEDLCENPSANFQRLCAHLGLTWTDEAQRWLSASNHAGRGLEVKRLVTEESDRWRTRLRADEVREIDRVLSGFPLETRGSTV